MVYKIIHFTKRANVDVNSKYLIIDFLSYLFMDQRFTEVGPGYVIKKTMLGGLLYSWHSTSQMHCGKYYPHLWKTYNFKTREEAERRLIDIQQGKVQFQVDKIQGVEV